MKNSPPVSGARIAAALALVYVIWGSTYLAIRVAVASWPPFLMSAIRFLISGSVLYAFLRLRGARRPGWVEWRSAAIVGAFLLLGGNGLVVWGEKSVPSGLAALMVSVAPLWMALADWARPGGQRPSARAATGLLLGFAGLVLLVGPDLGKSGVHLSGGLVAILLAAPAWAIGSVYSRRARLPASPFLATACEALTGGAALALVSLVSGETRGFSFASVPPAGWWALAYLILFGSLVAFTAYIYCLTHAPLSVASTYAFVNPMVAVALGWLILGEPVGGRTIAAGALVLAAVAIITTAGRLPAGDPAAGEA